MNKAQLLLLLEEEIQEKHIEKDFNVDCCTLYLDRSQSNEICFYYLKKSDVAEPRLRKRLPLANAAITIFNRKPDTKINIPHIIIKEGHWVEAQKKVCDHFYPIDWKSKKIIGVTGTNGKTTTVHLILNILKQLGRDAFSIGSLGIRDDSRTLEDLKGMTTPPYLVLRKILFRYFKKYPICAMEVSSHALCQKRVYKVLYDAVGWTNFSQDHLDYHGTLENYFQQKLKLPQCHLKKGRALIIPKGENLLAQKLSSLTIKITPELKKFGINIPQSSVFFNASFNKKNLGLALALVQEICDKNFSIQLDKLTFPPGRFELLEERDKCAIVDSAHTPDAMANVLKAIRKNFPGRKTITIFGCGGERDQKKRSIMGSVVEKNSDITIVTSDNPRSENPESIMKDITSGMKKFDYRESNRAKAIELGVSLLGDGRILAILGKGAETYQIIGTERKPFSDKEQFYNCAKKEDHP